MVDKRVITLYISDDVVGWLKTFPNRSEIAEEAIRQQMNGHGGWLARFNDFESEALAFMAAKKLDPIKALNILRRLRIIGEPSKDIDDYKTNHKRYTALLANLDRVSKGEKWEELN